MRVFVDADILKWLSNLLHIDSSKFNFALNDAGKCEVRSEDLIEDIGLGLVAGEVLKAVKELNRGIIGDAGSKDTSHKLDLLKHVKSSGAKAYNWNIVFEQLQSMIDIKVEKETRDLILADDKQVCTDLLCQIYTKCRVRGLRMNYLNSGPIAQPPAKREPKKAHSTASGNMARQGREDSQSALNRLNQSHQSEMRVPQNQGLFSNDLGNPQELNLETFDPFVEYSEAQNCLAFVLLAICKNIQVNALQAASLLANGNKYLSQLIVRGKKNQFQPLIAMLSDVYKHMATLVKLIEQEESQGSVKFVLQAFKAVFHSANIDVAKYGCRIYSKILYDLANREYLPDAWEWFGSLYGGFFAVHACFEHWQDEVMEPLCSVLSQAARFSASEMFTVELRKVMPIVFDYVRFMSHIIEPMSKSKLVKDDIQNAGIFEFLFEMALKCEEPENAKNLDFRVAALNLLMRLWVFYPYKFEVDATMGNAVISLMKRSARLPGVSHKISIYTFLVTLLHQFAADRNPYAPVVYKVLVFSLIENYKDYPIREFLSLNMKKILSKIPTLPVSILVDPITKQLDMYEDDNQITLHDIDLIRAIVGHPRLSLQSALQMFNSLSKLLLCSRPYQQSLSTIVIGLLRRHIEDSTFCEYAVKFVSVTLVAVFKSFKQGGAQRLDMERRLDNVHRFDSPTMANTEIEKELREKNWRAVMINTIRDIVMLRQSSVNDQLENRLLYTNREVFKLLGYNYKGIVTLLNILKPGVDALTTIDEYEREMKAVEEAKAANEEVHNRRAASPQTREQETDMYRKELYGERDIQDEADKFATHPDQLGPVRERRGGSRKRTVPEDRQSQSNKGPMKSQYGSVYKGLKVADDLDDLDAISQDDLDDLNEKFGGKLGLKSHTKVGAQPEKSDRKYQSGNIKVWKKDGADPRLRKHLEELKNKQEQAKLKEAERELSKKAKEERVNKQLEDELNWRKKGHPTKEKEMFLDLNLGEMYLRDTRPQAIDQHVLIDPIGGSEETLEREYTNMLLLKHKTSLQYLFKKYANMIPDKSKATFDLMGKRASSLSLPEVTKLLSDYFMTEFIDKAEIASLVKMINEADGNLKNLKYLDYDGFIKFMVNLASLIHSREPIAMSELSTALMFESTLDMIDRGRRMRGEELPNFGPQHSAKYQQEKDMIELMNFRLQENPEFALPPNFRKVREKKVNLEFSLPVSLMVSDSYKDCYEIVSDLIKDVFE